MKVKLALFALLFCGRAVARGRTAPPAAGALIDLAARAELAGYQGYERIQVFPPGRKPRGVTVAIQSFRGVTRRAWPIKKRKQAALTYYESRDEIRVNWAAKRLAWTGSLRRETPEATRARLEAFYTLNVSSGGKVAKYPTWRLDAADAGGVRESYWFARTSGILLKTEWRRSDGSLARRSRLSRLGFDVESSFPQDRASVASLAWACVPGRPAGIAPRWIPEGYLPTTTDGVEVQLFSDGAAKIELRAATNGIGEGRTALYRGRRYHLSDLGAGVVSVRADVGGRPWEARGDAPVAVLARILDSLEDHQ